jgi:flagellar motor switch protein FliN/FliY
MSEDNAPDDGGAMDDWESALAAQAMATSQPVAAGAAAFPPLEPAGSGIAKADIDRILDVPVTITAELGRARITIKSLLQLQQGSVVELDGLAGEPMEVLINGYLIAQGEVVVVNDKFGIRLTDIITPSERIQKLNR